MSLYSGRTFELFADGIQEQTGRAAHIDGERLWMESADEKRLLHRHELPQNGPMFDSGLPLLDWCWLIARRDIESNFYDGGMYAGRHFRSSATWVRDTSYSVLMGMDLHYGDKVGATLQRLLDPQTGEIRLEQYADVHEQRCYTMTDHIIWVLAAESYGRTIGRMDLLHDGAAASVRTISRMLRERFDADSGLFIGGSSFFDGSSGYPAGLTGPELRSISTNLLYARAAHLLAELPGVDQPTRQQLLELEQTIRAAIERQLWLDDRGHYAQFRHGHNYREHRYEAVAHALAIADPATPAERVRQIIASTPRRPFGTPAIWPPYQASPVYHTKAVWPFNLGLFLWALNCRRHSDGNAGYQKEEATLRDYLAGELLRTGMLEGTFMELIDAATGRGVYSPSQLWSAAAMLSLVQQTIFGMTIQTDRVLFRPSVPDFIASRPIVLRDVTIRGRRMTISLDERGRVSVDGTLLPDNTLLLESSSPCDAPGSSVVAPKNRVGLSLPQSSALAPEAATAANDTVKLSISPASVLVYPALDQIGSYDLTIKADNGTNSDISLPLECRWTGAAGRIDQPRMVLNIAAGEAAQATLRLIFDEPPQTLTQGEVLVNVPDAALEVTTKVRRVLTLEGHWQLKPMFKQASLGYSGDLGGYDYWVPPLRTPMAAEHRLGAYVGILWYVKRVFIPADWAGRELVFYAGAMGERDETYFNGNCIGGMGHAGESANGAKRQYPIASELVKPGELNSISVKIFSTTGKDIGITRNPLLISPVDGLEWAVKTAESMMCRNIIPGIKSANLPPMPQ